MAAYDTDYEMLAEQADSLAEEGQPTVTILSNIAALLYETLEDVSWAGFYIADGHTLYLGPFQGKVACVKIAYGRGVCGTAAQEQCPQLVQNVHDFPGHIACDSASNSEVVIPIADDSGRTVAVLDLDSTSLSRFQAEDQEGLEKVVTILQKKIHNWNILGA